MNLQENIRTLLKEEYGRKYILYRGVGLDEAIKSCETGHLVYYSRDPMSRDWEVIEYGLGSEASEMSEEEVEEYVNDLVSWKRKSKGVNLTSDLDNAKGYSDIVLEINLVGYDYAEFSDVHIFAKNPEDCKIKSVYYNGKEYSKEEFLDITKSLQESIRRILREETEPISNDMGEKYYISWDENYGKSFKLVKTPYGAQSGGKWEPNLVSIVTPENTNAWYEWEELSDEKLDMWKENWDNIQKTLGNHKYNQIIRNM